MGSHGRNHLVAGRKDYDVALWVGLQTNSLYRSSYPSYPLVLGDLHQLIYCSYCLWVSESHLRISSLGPIHGASTKFSCCPRFPQAPVAIQNEPGTRQSDWLWTKWINTCIDVLSTLPISVLEIDRHNGTEMLWASLENAQSLSD